MKPRFLFPLLALLVTGCEQATQGPTSIDGVTPRYGTLVAEYTDLGLRAPSPSSTGAYGRALAPGGPGTNAILNGSFEVNDGPGSTVFADWGTYNAGSGAVFAQTGTSSPLSGFEVPPPPDGDFAAMSDQFGPGTQILFQDVVVPRGATLGFDLYLGNRAGDFFSPPSLSAEVFPNQQFRADVMDPAAPIDDVGGGVLANVYQTEPGDPAESGYERIVYDLSAFEGQTVRIRFAAVDNIFFFQFGVDRVVVGTERPQPDPGEPAAYRVNGFGHQGSGNTIRTFSISTTVGVDGSVTGSFNLHARASGATLQGDITCATIWGSAAWLGGLVTSGPFEGREAVFRTVDTGAGTKGEFEDLLSFLALVDPGEAQQYCDRTPNTPPFFGAQGNITVVSPGQSSFTAVDVIELDGFSIYIPCALDGAGETVFFSGSLMMLFHFTEDQAGGFHLKVQNNPQDVSGYGSVSGDQYQGTGGTGGSSMYTISGVPYTDTFVNNFRIVGPGPGNDYVVQDRTHFTVNANGEVTVSNFSFRARCT